MLRSLSSLLDRVTGGRGVLAIRYSMVSVVGVVVTQAVLFVMVGVVDADPTWSNVTAVSVAAVPAFVLNKRWVWSRDGRVSLRREILPFWVFTLAGLLLSTLLVTLVKGMSDSTLLVMAANIAGFGVLWVAKFLFLDQVMFGRPELDEVMAQEDAGLGPA
ncbi:MAG TPA: GtrA family protein [Acidimicrobiales bacterium]|nr:GtrA family protein [Acidimicrobiales bacterium]